MKTYKTIVTARQGNSAVFTVNPPPLNQISDLLIHEMAHALEQAFYDDQVKTIIITGTGGDFIAGMDIASIRKIKEKKTCLSILEKANKMINSLENGPKPVIAAINGNCSRGGLEFALACHYRIAANNVRAGLLDVRFGLIPGFGGTQRLPRLIGIKRALEMITSARDVSAQKAKKMGLFDEICRKKDIIDTALAASEKFVSNKINFKMRITGKRFDQLLSSEEKQDIINHFKEKLKETAKGYFAPFKVVEAMEKGLGLNFNTDIKTESALFCQCLFSNVSRNLISIFLNTRNAGNFPWIKGERPRNIKTVGILGCGIMGSGIATLLLTKGFDIWLWDLDQKKIQKGLKTIRNSLEQDVKLGRITKKNMELIITKRLKLTTSYVDFKNVDLVIESVLEHLKIKQKIFRQLENICKENTIFSSNTSVIPIARISSVLRKPERMIGIHFFNPPDRIRLVEISSGQIVPDEILATAVNFVKRISKTPFFVKDGPGFYVSRQLFTFMSESCHMVAEGVDPFAIDRAATSFGLPIGPVRLFDITGMDVVYPGLLYFEKVFGDRWEIPPLAASIFKTGYYGIKTGMGWYDYRNQMRKPNIQVAKLIRAYWKNNNIRPLKMDGEDIMERLLLRAVNEGAYAIEQGISRRIPEMDLASVYGAGFPPHLGGIFRYADSWGVSEIYEKLLSLEEKKGPRFRPSTLLKDMAWSHRSFYEDYRI